MTGIAGTPGGASTPAMQDHARVFSTDVSVRPSEAAYGLGRDLVFGWPTKLPWAHLPCHVHREARHQRMDPACS